MSSRDNKLDAVQHLFELEKLLNSMHNLSNQVVEDIENHCPGKAKKNAADIAKACKTAAAVLHKATTVVNGEQSAAVVAAVNSLQVDNKRKERKHVFGDITNGKEDSSLVRSYTQQNKDILKTN